MKVNKRALESRNNSKQKTTDLTRITEEAPINNIQSLNGNRPGTSNRKSLDSEYYRTTVDVNKEERMTNAMLFDLHSLHPMNWDENKNETMDAETKKYEKWKRDQQQSFHKRYDNRRISHFIPALYLPYQQGSSKILLYFHANAEDIVLSHELLDYMRTLLKINILAVEYPGYGIYTEDF